MRRIFVTILSALCILFINVSVFAETGNVVGGAPANDMYLGTFYNGFGLRGEIPVGLFGNISGPLAPHMFDTTFYRCRNLTGPSARNPDGVPLYEQFSNAQATHVMHMYTEDTKLSDYADIPDAWK